MRRRNILITAVSFAVTAALTYLWCVFFRPKEARPDWEDDHEKADLLREAIGELKEQLADAREKIREHKAGTANEPLSLAHLSEKITAVGKVLGTGNAIIDALLEEKRAACRRENIELSTDMDMTFCKMGKVKDIHLYRVIANLLDNAMESCREFGPDQQKIRIAGRRQGHYIYIQSENPATQSYMMRPRRKGRGLGKKIIKAIVRQYDGQCWWQYEGGKCRAAVVLKVEE